MLVSPVNFAGTTSANFQDKIKQPQAFVQKDTPVASTTINNNSDEGMSTTKKAGIAVGVAALLATTLALVSKKTQILNPSGETGVIETAKGYLKTAGDYIADKAVAGYNFVKSHLPGAGKQAEAAPNPAELPPAAV